MGNREKVSAHIKKLLEKRAYPFFINVEDVSIVDLTFTKEFLTAVEAKQCAEQNAERASYLVEQAVQEKTSIIIKAEGEAISAELIGKSMNPAYLELKRIEASRKIAEIVSNSNNKAFIDEETLLMSITNPIQDKLLTLADMCK